MNRLSLLILIVISILSGLLIPVKTSHASSAANAQHPDPSKHDLYGNPVSEDPSAIMDDMIATFPGIQDRIGKIVSKEKLLDFDVCFDEAVDAGYPGCFARHTLLYNLKGAKGELKVWGHFIRDAREKNWNPAAGCIGGQRFECIGGHASQGRYTANFDLYQAAATDPAILKTTGDVRRLYVQSIQNILEKSPAPGSPDRQKMIYRIRVAGSQGGKSVEYSFTFTPGEKPYPLQSEWHPLPWLKINLPTMGINYKSQTDLQNLQSAGANPGLTIVPPKPVPGAAKK